MPFLVFVHDRHSGFDGDLVDGPRLVAGTSDHNVDALISNAVLEFLENLSSLAKIARSAVSVSMCRSMSPRRFWSVDRPPPAQREQVEKSSSPLIPNPSPVLAAGTFAGPKDSYDVRKE